MKDRQQKGSQHVPLWQTIINGLCKVIPSALPLYLWLDVFVTFPKVREGVFPSTRNLFLLKLS